MELARREITSQGYTSLIRWCPDVARAEYRNLAVILISRNEDFHGMRHLEPYELPEELRNSRIMHEWLVQFKNNMPAIELPELETFSRALWATVCVTPPKGCAVINNDWEGTLELLWNAFVAPR